MHGALAGGLGQHGSGNSQSAAGLFLIVAGDGGAHSLDGVLHAGTGSAVAGGVFQALLMTLDGRLMVSHGIPPIFWPAMQV